MGRAEQAVRLREYLRDTLGLAVSERREWTGVSGLPYYLREGYVFLPLTVLDTPVVAVIDGRPGTRSVSEIDSSLSQLRVLLGEPVVYVTEGLAAYQRNRLIEQKAPFIVPGNQLYLPDLGLDLREHFRTLSAKKAGTPLSHAAQAMLISALLRPEWVPEWRPAQAGEALGYSLMTVSRVVRELAGVGLGKVDKRGRTHQLSMPGTALETWERAESLLRSPVVKELWVRAPMREGAPVRLAGESALARLTMLSDPALPVYAVNQRDWREVRGRIEILPEADPGAQRWQIWNYSPALQEGSETVDPLSLTLSLRDEADERVQEALDEVRGTVPWFRG